MKKSILIISYILIGIAVSMANQTNSNKYIESSVYILLEDKDNVEIDTIATTLGEWWPLLLEKAKEGWSFQRLIYEEGEDVLLVIDRPIPPPKSLSVTTKEMGDCKYCVPELYDPNQPDYFEDSYFESGPCIIHVVKNKVVERICK